MHITSIVMRASYIFLELILINFVCRNIAKVIGNVSDGWLIVGDHVEDTISDSNIREIILEEVGPVEWIYLM